jgi:hypothetical protein
MSLGTEGALVLSTYLKANANGVLATLNIANNNFRAAGAQHIIPALKVL